MDPQAALPISWPEAVRAAAVAAVCVLAAVLLPGLLLAVAVVGGSRAVALRQAPDRFCVGWQWAEPGHEPSIGWLEFQSPHRQGHAVTQPWRCGSTQRRL